MNVLLLASHAVAEYDDVRMFTDMEGVNVFAPGGYERPGAPSEDLRPPIPNGAEYPDLIDACREVRERHAGHSGDWAIDWAKADLPQAVIDWADAIVVHHFPERWIAGPQWKRIREKRVIWRTCGQSNPMIEHHMASLVAQGLQVVRYSPKEQTAFEAWGSFAGVDALIRFGKYPGDFHPWIGDHAAVGNVSQWADGRSATGRGGALGIAYWQKATAGLLVAPAGSGSEALGGVGKLPYEEMLAYLQHIRTYLYTGTIPASYTLGLIEAMMAGVPVVSIGPKAWGPAPLFEGHEIAYSFHEDPEEAKRDLALYLDHPNESASLLTRQRAIDLFGIDTISRQWSEFLGVTA